MKLNARNLAGMSVRGRSLILRRNAEDFDAEWKESVAGLEAEDLVAFANSAKGGAILIGVVEKTMTIKNTPLSDRLKGSILDKARSCFPPVAVEVIAEKCLAGEIARVEVASGDFKPYCTHGGTYKIRGDGANDAIKPPALLQMFLEREGSTFLTRFTEATRQLQVNVLEMKENIEANINDVFKDVQWLDEKIDQQFEHVQDRVSEAAAEAEASSEASQSLDRRLDEIQSVIDLIDDQADLLLKYHGIEHPHVTRTKNRLFTAIEMLWRTEPGLNRLKYLRLLRKFFPGLEASYIRGQYDQKAAEVKRNNAR
jgi:hypothetical protein